MSNRINIPKADTILLKQGAVIACNLVGFPAEIVLFDDGDGNVVGYRIQPELELVKLNITVYSHLKEFSVWYMGAHKHATAPGKIKTFANLLTAIFDFSVHWETFKRLDPVRADVTVQLCRQAMTAVGQEMLKDIEKLKAGN